MWTVLVMNIILVFVDSSITINFIVIYHLIVRDCRYVVIYFCRDKSCDAMDHSHLSHFYRQTIYFHDRGLCLLYKMIQRSIRDSWQFYL